MQTQISPPSLIGLDLIVNRLICISTNCIQYKTSFLSSWPILTKWKTNLDKMVNRFLLNGTEQMSRDVRKPDFCIYAKTKTQISFAVTQISFAVTAMLISVFVFATWIVQYPFFLNQEFQVSSHLQWLRSPVCVGPGWNPRRPVFWRRGSDMKVINSNNWRIFFHFLWKQYSCQFFRIP